MSWLIEEFIHQEMCEDILKIEISRLIFLIMGIVAHIIYMTIG
jgi:hypothetical protein